MYCRNYTGTVSHVLERFVILCPYLGESPSEVPLHFPIYRHTYGSNHCISNCSAKNPREYMVAKK